MTQTANPTTPANTGVNAEDVIAELEGQLGQALGQVARLSVALRAAQQQAGFLRDQLAARDEEPAGTRE